MSNPILKTRVSKQVFITIPFLKFWAQTVHTLYRLSRPIVSRHAMLRLHAMFFD